MAKNVKWRIPFQSDMSLVEHRIDIYDEYSGNPIVLMAGSTPIVTSETNSENIETNLRPSTGTIQVCTKVPADSVAALGKSMITIEDMLPQDNADRCVVLQHKDGNNWVTDWQGFVSCEVYDQDYTANPQNLEIPIISIVEALDSIKLKYEDIEGYITIKTAIRMALAKVTNAAGISLFDRVYFPHVNYLILNKYIDPSILIEMSMHDNENRVDYIENGNSFKTIIENICAVMGWIVRESGRNLYFIPTNHNTNDSTGMVYQEYENFHSLATFTPASAPVALTTINMSSLTPMGTAHKKSIYQGKTFVEIIANIKKYSEYLELPDFPRGELIQATNDSNLYVCNNFAYSRFTQHKCILFNWNLVAGSHMSGRQINMRKIGSYNPSVSYIRNYIEHFVHREIYNYYYRTFITDNFWTIENYMYYVTSFFAKWKGFGTWSGDPYTPGETYTMGSDIEGLFLFGVPYTHMFHKYIYSPTGSYKTYIPTTIEGDGEDVYIYKQDIPNIFFANTGKLKLKLTCSYYDYMYWNFYKPWDGQYIPGGTQYSIRGRKVNLIDSDNDEKVRLFVAVKWGGKWYDGNGNWVDSFTRFWATFDENGNSETDLTIASSITGKVTVYLSPFMRGTFWSEAYNEYTRLDYEAYYPVNTMILTSLSLTYESNDEVLLSDRSTNNYFRLLDTKFHDGLSVHTDIATDNLNKQSPSIIVDSYTDSSVTFLRTLPYNLTSGTVNRRPEIDLLDRLSKWYGQIRRKIELEVERPTEAALPMMKVRADSANGYDGKLYLPIAEDRDWKTEKSTITFMEDSDGDTQ